MKKLFISTSVRYITIEITDEYILFYGSTSSKETKEGGEFYWIPKDEWFSPSPHHDWEYHMTQKKWFTEDMLKFIKENISHNTIIKNN